MFGNNKKEEKKKIAAPIASANGINTLIHGTSLEGTLKADNDIRIDGKLNGILNCRGKVIIGPTGEIEGEVNCANAVIEGRFKGTLVVTEILSVRDSAKIEGDIQTDKLVVQSGAVFNVTCAMGKKPQFNTVSTESKSVKKEESLTLN